MAAKVVNGNDLSSSDFRLELIASKTERIYLSWKHLVLPPQFATANSASIPKYRIAQYVQNDRCLVYHLSIINGMKFVRQPTCEKYEEYGMLARKMLDTLLSGKGSDVTLATKDGQIAASKFMLSISSSVFTAMFEGDQWKDAIDGRVEIDDISYKTMMDLVRFMYCGQLELDQPLEAMLLYKAADKYDVRPVKKITKKYIIKNIFDENGIAVLEFGDLYNELDVVSAAVDIVSQCVTAENVVELLRLGNLRKEDKLTNAALSFMVSKECPDIDHLPGFDRSSSYDILKQVTNFIKKRNVN